MIKSFFFDYAAAEKRGRGAASDGRKGRRKGRTGELGVGLYAEM